jgi:hypothetical protein
MNTTNEILDFIHRRFNKDCNWMNGNCYYFSIILKERFPNGKIIYDPIVGHFMYLINHKCFDALGSHKIPNDYYDWEELKNTDYLLYNRIKRDCIM